MKLLYTGLSWVQPTNMQELEVSDQFHALCISAADTHKVALIKFARVEYSLGLREAKELVEKLASTWRPTPN